MQDDSSDNDSVVLPSTFPDWDDWNCMAFEHSNSRVFVKLGTWIMLRFRQLAGIPLKDSIDSLLIPDHPASFDIDHDADYHEALGMHGLFSAIAYMESHPQYLSHIFHELGKASAEGRLNNSHPGIRSVPEPPTPVQRYVDITIYAKAYSACSTVLTEGLEWMRLHYCPPPSRCAESCEEDANFELDNDDRDVSTALDEMDISGAPASPDRSDSPEAHKRKRSMSSTFSPPKVNPWVGQMSETI
jgi:hypothetical protein